MPEERIWFRQDTGEMAHEWLLDDLEPGARWAYLCMKAYIKVERPSQKRHSRAERLGYRAAARRWNVSPEDVEAMERAAIAAGRLLIEGDEWVLTDVTVCAHEDTAKRKAAKDPQTPEIEGEPEQTGANEPDAEICAANGSKREQTGAPCHATVTETGTVIQPTVEGDVGRAEEISVMGILTTEKVLDPSDGLAYWNREETAQPMRTVACCLCRVAELVGVSPPLETEIGPHLSASKPCRLLAEKLGWEEAAKLYVWVSEHVPSGRSWSAVWGNYQGYLNQMRNGGVTNVPRNPAPKPLPAARESVAERAARRTAMMTGGTNAA